MQRPFEGLGSWTTTTEISQPQKKAKIEPTISTTNTTFSTSSMIKDEQEGAFEVSNLDYNELGPGVPPYVYQADQGPTPTSRLQPQRVGSPFAPSPNHPYLPTEYNPYGALQPDSSQVRLTTPNYLVNPLPFSQPRHAPFVPTNFINTPTPRYVSSSPDTRCSYCLHFFQPHEKMVLDRAQAYHAECVLRHISTETLFEPPYGPQNTLGANPVLPYFSASPSVTPPGNKSPPKRAEKEISSNKLDIPEGFSFSIITHPAEWQVANYNIYPTPALSFNNPLTTAVTLTANLIEGTTNKELLSGLQAGHYKMLQPGVSVVQFTGLKLNKMGKIKNELAQQNLKLPDSYYLQFRVGSKVVDSNPFKMVSSTSQMTKEVRESMRPPPTKKGSKSKREDDPGNW